MIAYSISGVPHSTTVRWVIGYSLNRLFLQKNAPIPTLFLGLGKLQSANDWVMPTTYRLGLKDGVRCGGLRCLDVAVDYKAVYCASVKFTTVDFVDVDCFTMVLRWIAWRLISLR